MGQDHAYYNMAEGKVEDDTQRYQCGYCGCDITLRLKCAECADLDLCLQCFASGAYGGTHKPDHAYQLIDEGSFPLLTEDWGAIEEVLLLDAIEQDGFGNWEDTAAHVVTKTARESRDHYSEVYVNGTIGESLLPRDHHCKALERCGGEIAPSPPSFVPIKLDHSEQQELSYLPLRDDFEKEYNNDAEKLISGISINYDDEDIETALKLAHVDMYARKLVEREKRKSIAKQHGLIGGKQRVSAFKRKFGKEERELRAKLRPLARLLDADDYEKLVASMKKERQLKQRIKDLSTYRRHGITKSDDCPEFDMLRQEQEKMKEMKENKDVFSSIDDTSGGLSESDHLTLSPEVVLLSSSERKLCSSLSLKPQLYLDIKTDVLKSSATKRYGYPSKLKLPKSISSDTKQKLLKHFSRAGWI